jgi:hypothetical protein
VGYELIDKRKKAVAVFLAWAEAMFPRMADAGQGFQLLRT